MIFNSEFDKSLWLLIKGDIKNRKKIVEFIESIPSELILSIRDSLIEYDKYKMDNIGIDFNNREYKCFNNQMYTNYGELFSFNIDSKKDILSITKSIYIMGAYYRNFSIELKNLTDDKGKSRIGNIGNVYYSIDGIGNVRKINYDIMNIGATNFLVSYSNNGIHRLCGLVDLDKDFEINIDNKNGKLVRTKKKDNGKDNKNV